MGDCTLGYTAGCIPAMVQRSSRLGETVDRSRQGVLGSARTGPPALGLTEPHPSAPLHGPLERRWLHYAFLSRSRRLAMVANLSVLGPVGEQPPQRMGIVLVHDDATGWRSSQFNAVVPPLPWSSFRCTPAQDPTLALRARSGAPAVSLGLRRTSRPCTSQCAGFADWQHLRWQSESGIIANGDWTIERGRTYRSVHALGYHERVRGRWGWPELGGWVFGFANDDKANAADIPGAPSWAVVFTLIQPSGRNDQATSSVMLWRQGRLRRHFPRRLVSVAVEGTMDRDFVFCVPPLAATFGTRPARAVPQRLVFTARMGGDRVVLDVAGRTAARIVNPSETSLQPFSVHEVLGDCLVEGICSGQRFSFATQAIVEFAGGACDA